MCVCMLFILKCNIGVYFVCSCDLCLVCCSVSVGVFFVVEFVLCELSVSLVNVFV